MTEDPINLVLIVKEEKDQAFYQSHLASYEDIELEVFPSFLEFRNQCHGKLYSGFLVDIRTLIRSAGLRIFLELRSPVCISQNNINAADDRHQVGHVMALCDPRQ